MDLIGSVLVALRHRACPTYIHRVPHRVRAYTQKLVLVDTMAAIIIVNFATFCARAVQVTGVASFAEDFGNAAGRRLAHAGIVGAEVFPRKSTPDPSETGAIMALGSVDA